MSNDPLFAHTLRALDVIFPAEPAPAPAPLEAGDDDDSELGASERTSIVLCNGDVIDVDLFQVSATCWSAKNANHDHQCGWGETRDRALRDLRVLCEDELELEDDSQTRYVDSLDLSELL